MIQLILKTKSETIKKDLIQLLHKDEIEVSDLSDLAAYMKGADFSFADLNSKDVISIECSSPEFIDIIKSFPKNTHYDLGWLLKQKTFATVEEFAKKDHKKLRRLLELADLTIPASLSSKAEIQEQLNKLNEKLSACKPGDAQAFMGEIKDLIHAYLKAGATHDDSVIANFYRIVKTRFSEDSASFSNELLWLDESLSGAQLLKEMKKRNLTLLSVPSKEIQALTKLAPLVSPDEKRSYIQKNVEAEVIKALCASAKNGEVVDKSFLLKNMSGNNYYNNEVASALLTYAPMLDIQTIKKIAESNAQELLETGHISKDNLDEKLIKVCGNDLLSFPWVFKNEKTLLSICKSINSRELSVVELIETGFSSVRQEVIKRGTTSFLCTCFSMFEPAEQAEIKTRLLKDLKGSESSNLLKIADYLSDAEFSKVAKTSAKTVDGAIEVLQESTSHKLRALAIARLLKSSFEKDILSLAPKFKITPENYPQITEHIVKSDMSHWALRNVSGKIFQSNIDAFIAPIQKLLSERINAEEVKELITKCSDEQLTKIFSKSDSALINILDNKEGLGIDLLVRVVQCAGIDAVNKIVPSLDEDYAETMIELSDRVKIPDLNNFSNFNEALGLTRIARGNADLAKKILDLAIHEDSSEMSLNDIKRVMELDEATQAHGNSFKKWALKNIDYISDLLNRYDGAETICHDEDAFNMAISAARLSKNKNAVSRLVFQMASINPQFILNDLSKYTDKDNLDKIVKIFLLNGSVHKDNAEVIEIMQSLPDSQLSYLDFLNIKEITPLAALELYTHNLSSKKISDLLYYSTEITDRGTLDAIFELITTDEKSKLTVSDVLIVNPVLVPVNQITREAVDKLSAVDTINKIYQLKKLDIIVDCVVERLKKDDFDFTSMNNEYFKDLLNAVIQKMEVGQILAVPGFTLLNADLLTLESKKKLQEISAMKLVGEKFQAKYSHDTETIKIIQGSELLKKAFDSKNINSDEFVISSYLHDALSLSHKGMTIDLTGLCDQSDQGGIVAKLDININTARKTTEDLSREINEMILKKAKAIQQKAISEIPTVIKWYATIGFDKVVSSGAVTKGLADAEGKTKATFDVKTSPNIRNPQKKSWSSPKHGKVIISPRFSGEEGVEQMKCVFDRLSEESKVKSVEISFKTSEFDKIGLAHQQSLIELTREMNSVIKASGVFSGAGQIWDDEENDSSQISLDREYSEIVAKFSGSFGDGSGLTNTIKVLTSIISQYILAIKKEISSEENLTNISTEIVRNLDFENISQSEAKMKLLEAAKPLYKRGA